MTYKVPFKFHSTEVGRLNQSRSLSVSRGFDQRGVVGGVFLLSGVIVCKGGCVFFVDRSLGRQSHRAAHMFACTAWGSGRLQRKRPVNPS